jgi:RNA polymerase sigma factor (sigma-70 family)
MARQHTYSDSELLELWQSLRQGDSQALADLMSSQYNALFQYAAKFTPETEIVRDAIQDLFLELWEKKAALSEVKSVKPYLLTALRNKILKAIVQQNRIIDLDNILFDFKDPNFNIEQKHIAHEIDAQNNQHLHQLMAQLTDRQREILHLRFFQNLNNDDIAHVMAVNKQSVANLLHRTLKELKERWIGSIISLLAFLVH